MFENQSVKRSKALAAIPFFHSLIWQFHNSYWNYSLSIVNILEERLYTFVLARVTFGTITFFKELLFRNIYSLNFLSGYCSFWEASAKRIYLKHQIFVKTIDLFQNTTCSCPFFKTVCRFTWREEYWLVIHWEEYWLVIHCF